MFNSGFFQHVIVPYALLAGVVILFILFVIFVAWALFKLFVPKKSTAKVKPKSIPPKKIGALKADLAACTKQLDNNEYILWDTRKFAEECNLQGQIVPDNKYLLKEPVYLSHGAWAYFKECVTGFDVSEGELAGGLIESFVSELPGIIKAKAEGRPHTGGISLKALKNIKSELQLQAFGFDVFAVFYRVSSGRIEVIQFVDEEEMETDNAYREYSTKPKTAETIGGQKKKVSYKPTRDLPIDWWHLKPSVIFASLVLFAMGCGLVLLDFFLVAILGGFLAGHDRDIVGGIGFCLFLQCRQTLKDNNVSHFLMGIVLSIVGLLAYNTFITHIHDSRLAFAIAGFYYFYIAYCFIFAMREVSGIGLKVTALSILLLNSFPLYLVYINYR